MLCKNKLDGRRYAMKKIRLKDKSPISNEKILRLALKVLVWSQYPLDGIPVNVALMHRF